MDAIGIIPARYASTRFPGKPLADIFGKPMIQRVYEQAKKSKLLKRVIVATDDKRIFHQIIESGGEAIMTSGRYESGTDRVASVVKDIDCELVVNIQGDEPFIPPGNIDLVLKPMLTDKSILVTTLAIKLNLYGDIFDPGKVKVVIDKDRNALYFSRSPIPYQRDEEDTVIYYKHIGLYVFRKDFLMKFPNMRHTNLEKAEKLEQLRILENGVKIKVIITKKDSVSVDTKKDIFELKKFINKHNINPA